MDAEAEKKTKACRSCQLATPMHYDLPIQSTNLPDKPWSDLAMDLMGSLPNGNYLFVVVEFFEVDIMPDTSSAKLIRSLSRIFARFGLPLSVRTDNGPQFVSQKFKNFLSENGIVHRINTPLWPRANGEVEKQNRTILKILKIAQLEGRDTEIELNKLLLAYRSTPHTTTGRSLAKLLFGREMRSKIPQLETSGHDNYLDVREHDAYMKFQQKEQKDAKRGHEPAVKVGTLYCYNNES